MNQKNGKILRSVAVILLGLTAAMNLLGGAGTTCAAFLTKQYPPMWALNDYRWLYQFLVFATIATGVAGIWAMMSLIKRDEKGFRNALIILVIGTILGGIHMTASLILRGKAVPANVKLYINLITLILFIILRLPGVWEKINFSGPADKGENSLSGGLTAILSGTLILTTFIWSGPSHTYEGVNWVFVLDKLLLVSGVLSLLIGIGLIIHWLVVVFELKRAALTETTSS